MELWVHIAPGLYAQTSTLGSVWPSLAPIRLQVPPPTVTSFPSPSRGPVSPRLARLCLPHPSVHSLIHSLSQGALAGGRALSCALGTRRLLDPSGSWAPLSSSPSRGGLFLFWLANLLSESFHLTKSLLVCNSLSPHIFISPFPHV